jgi:uncharacterized protein (DUF488 family)
MPTSILTVGHSNRTLIELIDLLRSAGIHTLVDVRAYPQSRRHPQFSSDSLRSAVEDAGMIYHWAGRRLGGKRFPRPDSPHLALAEDSLRGYADYMQTDAFQKAAAQLTALAGRTPTAILCAERSPENCHRSLISDYLTLQGVRVVHLITPSETGEHQLSPLIRRESARLVYDRNATGSLDLG